MIEAVVSFSLPHCRLLYSPLLPCYYPHHRYHRRFLCIRLHQHHPFLCYYFLFILCFINPPPSIPLICLHIRLYYHCSLLHYILLHSSLLLCYYPRYRSHRRFLYILLHRNRPFLYYIFLFLLCSIIPPPSILLTRLYIRLCYFNFLLFRLWSLILYCYYQHLFLLECLRFLPIPHHYSIHYQLSRLQLCVVLSLLLLFPLQIRGSIRFLKIKYLKVVWIILRRIDHFLRVYYSP